MGEETSEGTAPALPSSPRETILERYELEEEVSSAEAAAILGVDKKTVRKYLDAGMLEWRDAAPPGSARPVFRFTLRSVLRLRTSYRTTPPSGSAAPYRNARPTGSTPRLKHVRLGR